MSRPAFQLVISMTAEGKVDVTGPLDQKVICYGLLAMARDIIQHYQPPKPDGLSVIHRPLPPV